jgi:hypothetical protein
VIYFPPSLFTKIEKEVIFMEFFNELDELELIELYDRENELRNELEAFNNGDIKITDLREIEIYDELDEILNKIDLLK